MPEPNTRRTNIHLQFLNNTAQPLSLRGEPSPGPSPPDTPTDAPTLPPYSTRTWTVKHTPFPLHFGWGQTDDTRFVLEQDARKGLLTGTLRHKGTQTPLTPAQPEHLLTLETAQQSLRLRTWSHVHWLTGTQTLTVLLSDDSRRATIPLEPSPSPTSLLLLTYNIYAIPTRASQERARRARLLVDSRVLEGFDVLVLQEVFCPRTRRFLQDALHEKGYPHWSGVLARKGTKFSNGGVIVASRHPFAFTPLQMVYRAGQFPDCLAAKGAIYAPIQKAHQRYHVFATHLQADEVPWGRKRAPHTRLHQLQELHQWASTCLQGTQQPVIYAGDFNIDRLHAHTEYKRLLDTLQATPPTRTNDFPSYNPQWNTLAKGTAIQDLDHILHTPTPQHPSTLTTSPFQTPSQQLPQTLQFSDHFAVYSHLQHPS